MHKRLKAGIFAVLFSSITVLSLAQPDMLEVNRQGKAVINSSKKTVLLFWTTWCPYCRTAVKEFGQVCKNLQDKGYGVYMVNIAEEEAKVSNFIQRMGVDCPVILDKEGELGSEYRILGIPTYIFLKDGDILGRTGYISLDVIEKVYEQ
jgi:thiol-disulfide isomerase/thioredoxin